MALFVGNSPCFHAPQFSSQNPLQTDNPLSLRADHSVAVTYRAYVLLYLYYTLYLKNDLDLEYTIRIQSNLYPPNQIGDPQCQPLTLR